MGAHIWQIEINKQIIIESDQQNINGIKKTKIFEPKFWANFFFERIFKISSVVDISDLLTNLITTLINDLNSQENKWHYFPPKKTLFEVFEPFSNWNYGYFSIKMAHVE